MQVYLFVFKENKTENIIPEGKLFCFFANTILGSFYRLSKFRFSKSTIKKTPYVSK
jgi:hypothetical protein